MKYDNVFHKYFYATHILVRKDLDENKYERLSDFILKCKQDEL